MFFFLIIQAWNYYLEQNATNLLKNCSRNNFISRVFTTIGDDEGPKGINKYLYISMTYLPIDSCYTNVGEYFENRFLNFQICFICFMIIVPAYEEGVVTSFQMETGLQSELRSIIWRLIIENYLKDWDEE